MSRLKADAIKQLSEPIIIEAGILGDKEYKVDKITTDLLKRVNDLASEKNKQLPFDAPINQLALLLGVPANEFSGIDIRIVGRVLDFIMSEITEGIKARNPSGAEATH